MDVLPNHILDILLNQPGLQISNLLDIKCFPAVRTIDFELVFVRLILEEEESKEPCVAD